MASTKNKKLVPHLLCCLELFLKDTYKSIIKWKRLTEIPFIRGAFNFIDSMVLGIKTLTYSASFIEEEEPKEKAVTAMISYYIFPLPHTIKGLRFLKPQPRSLQAYLLIPYFLSILPAL